MTPRQQEIADAVAAHGSHRAAARALGMHPSRVDDVMKRLRATDPAWAEAAQRRGFDASHGGWIKWAPTEDQPGASVYVGRAPGSSAIEALRSALAEFDGRAEPRTQPRDVRGELLNLVAVPDWHAGMLAWRRASGADYDLRTAASVLRDGLAATVPRLPPAGVGVLLALGDNTHTNDARNVTPRSGHVLDVDGRYLKIMETAADTLLGGVALMLEHHAEVEVVILPGNHDPEAAQMLGLALRMFYAREPRVRVWDGAGLWWRRQHGRNLLAATHGHAIRQAAIGPYMAAEWPELWGATRWRFAFSGHIHHERSLDLPGVLCEALRPVTPRDAHAAGAYQSQSEITAMTFDADRGRVSRVYEAIA